MNETSFSSDLLNNKSLPTAKKPNHDYLALIQFETPNKNSSFGKVPTSDIKTSPQYGFGSSEREKAKNLYLSKDLAKVSLFGTY